MKNTKIKSVQFNTINIKKSKSRTSIINFIQQSKKNQKKSVQIKSGKKTIKNRNFSLSVKKSKSTFKFSKIINYLKKGENTVINENKENIKTKKIMTYTEIRQYIYKKLKQNYISPYIEKFQINQNYIDKTEYDSFYLEPAKYYDYFQICYLINGNKKNYRLLSRLHDHLIGNDDQEYLMKFYIPEEFYINMKYLLYCIYEKDKSVSSNNPKRGYVDKNICLELYKKWNENVFHFEDTFDIFENGRKFLKVVITDSFRHRMYFTRLNTIFGININYVYVQDMPKEFIPNCVPNLFPHINEDIYNLKVYINIKANNNKENIESLLNKSHKDKSIQKFFRNSNNNWLKKENKSFGNDYICNNISFSSKEEKKENEEINSFLPKENINNNKINNDNKDFKEIKYLLQKFYNSKIQKQNEEEKIPKHNKILYKKILKINSIKYKQEEENKQDFIKSITNNSKNEENKNIKINNRNLLLKIGKKELYKMSFNKSNSLSKTNKDTSDKSTIYNPSSFINEHNFKINIDNNSIHLTRNRKNKREMKVNKDENLIREAKSFFFFKSKATSEKTINKNNINSYQERTLSEKKDSKIINNNEKYTKPFSCNNIRNRIHIQNMKKYFKIKDTKINKSHIFSLNNFEKLFLETKKKGLLPKGKICYKMHNKPFKGVYGHNFFIEMMNKKRNYREIEEENKAKDAYNLEKLKMNIKKMLKSDKLFFKNNYSLEEIVKCPNLYFNND